MNWSGVTPVRFMVTTSTKVVAGMVLVHPLISVTVRLYVPALAKLAGKIVGFLMAEVKPAGPLQA